MFDEKYEFYLALCQFHPVLLDMLLKIELQEETFYIIFLCIKFYGF